MSVERRGDAQFREAGVPLRVEPSDEAVAAAHVVVLMNVGGVEEDAVRAALKAAYELDRVDGVPSPDRPSGEGGLRAGVRRAAESLASGESFGPGDRDGLADLLHQVDGALGGVGRLSLDEQSDDMLVQVVCEMREHASEGIGRGAWFNTVLKLWADRIEASSPAVGLTVEEAQALVTAWFGDELDEAEAVIHRMQNALSAVSGGPEPAATEPSVVLSVDEAGVIADFIGEFGGHADDDWAAEAVRELRAVEKRLTPAATEGEETSDGED